MELLTALVIGVLFAAGIFQMLRRNVIRAVMGLIILSSAINLFLLSAGISQGTQPAYVNGGGIPSDPLPQALILTAIVISMGGTAFVLALLYIISARYRTSDVDEINNLRH
ncbi:MAG: NADH-quinone oxidoreductase subunit K [Ardenticatenales bacterium]|nr:NADH-quinone oxidoreductase subunit K [Ardenticatenales bacterium]